MYRQKGTGNARAGSRRSPIRRGGGHTFRKGPRDFGYRLPRKAVQVATRMAIASKLNDDEVMVIDEPGVRRSEDQGHGGDPEGPEAATTSSLLVTTAAHDRNVYKSARNIDGVRSRRWPI